MSKDKITEPMANPDYAAVMDFYSEVLRWPDKVHELECLSRTPVYKRSNKSMNDFAWASIYSHVMPKAVPVLQLCQRDKRDATFLYRFLRDVQTIRRRTDCNTSDVLSALDNLRLHIFRTAVPVPQKQNTLDVSENGNGSYTATLNSACYPLSMPQYTYLRSLLDANGGYYAPPKNSSNRPGRIRKSLPVPIKKLIESKPRYGSRLITPVAGTSQK
jgi:hypothetical protein